MLNSPLLQLHSLQKKHQSKFQYPFQKESLQGFNEEEDKEFNEILDLHVSDFYEHTDEKVIEKWKEVLSVLLLNTLTGKKNSSYLSQIQNLLNRPRNKRSQYLRVLIALCECLVGLPVGEIPLTLLEGGAIPLDLREYCPWQAIPFSPYHTEMAVFLSLLTHLTGMIHLKENLMKIVEWQLNTLDINFLPIIGLYSREKEASKNTQIVWNYLLFESLFHLMNESRFFKISEAYRNLLSAKEFNLQMEGSNFSLAVLIERFMKDNKIASQLVSFDLFDKPILGSLIYDSSTALIGKREPHYHVVATLHGSNTGFGSVRYEDVSFVSFGPQHLPLGECLNFGIEGNHLSDHGVRKSVLKVLDDGFLLKGCTRLVDKEVEESHKKTNLGELYGIWFETEMQLKFKKFVLNAHLLGFDNWDNLSFSFFIKAKKCRINENKSYLPCTFERYEGEVVDIYLEGEKGEIQLSSNSQQMMQIIPLAGTENFWGADFLISYTLQTNQKNYTWEAIFKELR